MKYDIQQLMSPEEMSKVHQAALTILETTGMQIDHDLVRSRLRDAGAKVEDHSNIVKFPPDMVEACIKKVPETICLAGRDPQYDIALSYDSPFVTRCGAGLTSIVDHQDGAYRDTTIGDLKHLALIADALNNISIAAPLTVHDVPGKTADLHAARTLLNHQRKHFMSLTMGPRNMRYLNEMQLAVRGSREEVKRRPLFHPIACLISPLYIPEDAIEIMLIAGEFGLPLKIPVMPMLGASAPVTIAGVLSMGNAEVLGSLTVFQTLWPGNPTFYYLVPGLMDMRSGSGIFAAPETSLLYAAITQMARFCYRIPSDTTSLNSDGILIEQTTFQKGTNLFAAGLSGANIVSGAGSLDGGMALSLPELVIDDEITGLTRRRLMGFDISDETLALECIDRVGPKNNFLVDTHTLQNCRNLDLYIPEIFTYQNFASWQTEAKQLPEIAKDKVNHILDTHEVPPLDGQVIKELDRIVKSADAEIAKT